jgi:hypothetical protein
MKKIKYLFISLALIGVSSSCSNETINSEPIQYVSPDIVYGNVVFITQMVNRLYVHIPGGYNRLGGSSMVASATDEAVHAARGSEAELWGTGAWGTTPASQRDGLFSALFAGIRATYIYSEDVHPFIVDGVMNKTERDSHYGQTLFIRALLNFELLKRYGGYPIVTKKLSPADDLNIPKSTYDECVRYIASLCDEAIPLLKTSHPTADFGRATKGAAMALKARLLLYAASPLHNPGSDVSKWVAAAEAAEKVISLTDGSKVYDLYTAGSGYDAFFYTLAGNREIIFSKMEVRSNTIERLNGPVSLVGGAGGTNPSLDLVNAYERIDGTPFDWNNPEHAADPFANRDPRMAKSILFNGSSWMGTTIETFEGGKDLQTINATRTGFYLRKFMSPNARFVAPTGVADHCFPLFRYAEVLLNYAEAMNEAYGPDVAATFNLTAREALSLIRKRAGLTDNLSLSSLVSKEDFREAIRKERRIELAFEEHRHLDVRRWKIAEEILNKPVTGLKIVKASDGSLSYESEIVEPRLFHEKMYFYPFPQEEISRNTALRQNTGW